MEVQPLHVLVLADTAIRAADMDESLLKQALEEAKQEMQDRSGHFDYSKASAHLVEVSAQLQTLEKVRRFK
jgi:F-type H+-transporting ATPase subunit epsilon